MSVTNAEGKEYDVIDPSTQAKDPAGSGNSLFSAFYVFKYGGGVDIINSSTYVNSIEKSRNNATPTMISNPSAAAIINWARALPENSQANQFGVENSPYTWADFLFCKWYGIVPNNRLVTLRKFPLATEDDLSTKRKPSSQNIPVAQAVTWFGGPTGNDINSIWQSSWSIPWTKKSVDAKEVQGNEVTNISQSFIKLLPADISPFVKKVFENLATQTDFKRSGTGTEYEQAAGAEIEKLEQDYLKSLWSDTGAFWNQIQGPVNVKNQFLIRDRGLSNGAPDAQWKLKFEYKTDSYYGLSQRRVALDIIANMLNLTYSDGEWLKSLNIYYKKIGIPLAETEQNLIEAAMVNGVLNPEKLAKAFADIAKSRAADIISNGLSMASSLASVTAGTVTGAFTNLMKNGEVNADAFNTAVSKLSEEDKKKWETAIGIELTKALAASFPVFLQQRSAVPGIPTGNWHLTIGNPMNPIMRIGDLVVKDCTLTFGDELGPDDFPIDLTFDVTLSPTKPRAGQDIRKTFNSGRIDYINNFEGHTFDQANTYGRQNKGLIAVGSGQPTADDVSNTTPPKNKVDRVTAWINEKYGPGMANASFLQDVYFYVPKNPDLQGGTKKQ